MTNKVRKIIYPTPEEDAEINAQIAEDPDDFEADAEWFKEAKPSAEIIPPYTGEIQSHPGKAEVANQGAGQHPPGHGNRGLLPRHR